MEDESLLARKAERKAEMEISSEELCEGCARKDADRGVVKGGRAGKKVSRTADRALRLDQRRQAANAVPPPLAKSVEETVKSTLRL